MEEEVPIKSIILLFIALFFSLSALANPISESVSTIYSGKDQHIKSKVRRVVYFAKHLTLRNYNNVGILLGKYFLNKTHKLCHSKVKKSELKKKLDAIYKDMKFRTHSDSFPFKETHQQLREKVKRVTERSPAVTRKLLLYYLSEHFQAKFY